MHAIPLIWPAHDNVRMISNAACDADVDDGGDDDCRTGRYYCLWTYHGLIHMWGIRLSRALRTMHCTPICLHLNDNLGHCNTLAGYGWTFDGYVVQMMYYKFGYTGWWMTVASNSFLLAIPKGILK